MTEEIEKLKKRVAQLENELFLHKSGRQEPIEADSDFFTDMFHNLNDGLGLASLTGEVLAANQALFKIIDVPESEIIGHNITMIVKRLLSPSQALRALPKILNIVAGKKVRPFIVLYKDKTLEISSIFNRKANRIIGIIRDITEQQAVLKQLRDNESFIKSLTSASPNLIYVFDIGLKQNIYCNRSISQFLGYKETELFDSDPGFFQKVIHPDDLKQFDQFFEDVKKWPKAYVHHFEYRMFDKTGKWRWFRGSEKEFSREQGKIVSLVGSVQEITNEKNAALELQKSAQTFADLAHSIPSGLFIYQFVEPDKLFLVTGNPEAEKLTGIKVEDWIGKDFDQIWPNAKNQGFSEKYLEVAKTLKATELNDVYYSDKRISGAFRIKVFPMPGSRIGVAFENITRAKQAEQALKDREQRLGAIYSSAGVCIAILGLDGMFLEANQAFLHLVGYTKEELLALNIRELSMPEEYLNTRERLSKIIAGELDWYRIERQYINKNGESSWVDMSVTPLRDENGQVISLIGTGFNITSRKKAEQALVESEKKVKAKLDAVLLPEGDIAALELSDIIDIPAIQAIMDDFYQLTKIGIGIIDIKGKVLVATGWQDICTKFHRVHPETEKKCIESDLFLSKGVSFMQCKAYKCKNNLWDIVTPVIIGGKHLGNIFLGQFHYAGEIPDEAVFKAQAKKYKFNEKQYLEALRKVPVWDTAMVNSVMAFYMKFANLISTMSYSNIKLARTLEQQKIAEEALKYSEERFRSLIENAPDGVVIVNSEGNISYASPNAFKHFGYSDGEIIGQPGSAFTHPDDLHRVHESFSRIMVQPQEKPTLEYRFLRKDGEYRWIETTFSNLLDAPSIHGFVLNFADITDEKAILRELISAKEKAEESELKFRTVANYTNDWEYWQSPDGRLVFVSPSCQRVTGYTVEEFVSFPGLLLKIVHPDDKPAMDLHFNLENSNIKTDSFHDHVFRIIKKDGGIVYLEHICRPLFDEHGQYIGRRVSNRDITERMHASDIRRSMAEMLDNAPSSITVHDMNGNFIYANKKTFDMHGFTPSEFLALNLHKLDVPESEDLIEERIQAIKRQGWAKFEVHHYRKDGSVFPLEIFTKMVEWLGIKAILSIATDISDRKLAELELLDAQKKVETSEELYRTTFEKAAVGIAHVNPDGSFIRVNQKFCDIVGYPKDELLKISVASLTHPEDMELENEFIHKVIENKIDTFSIEKRYIHKSGKIIWIKLFSNVIRDVDNRPLFAVASISDITEQKLLYEELLKSKLKTEESEFKLRGMFENTHTGILYFDKEGSIFDANPAVLRILGSPSLEESKKINLLTFKPLIDIGFSRDILKCIDLQDIVVSDVVYTSKWGKTVYMKYYLIPIVQNGEITGIWANLQDLTDLWNTQNELIKAKEKAEESDRLKTAFLQNMSHEIRTPMNGIIGFSSLYSKPGMSDEKRERYADLVIKSCQQLLGIVNDILDISMMETGKIKLNSDEVSLNHLMDELYNLYGQKCEDKKLDLSANKPNALSNCCITTDYVRIKQVLTNLLNNAIKFTHIGKIEFGYEFCPQGIRFYVSDTGIGISKENQKKVFERFFQEESDISRQYGGNGLGLSISAKLVELLGGEMHLQSEKGKGSCFSFVLPVFCKQNFNYQTPAYQGSTNTFPGNETTVLIAEDEEINFLYLNELLSQMGHKIIRAKNGKEAVDICHSAQKPDVVLMDIKMPVLNGYEATRQIRAFDVNLPIIAHTAYARPEDKAKALEAGCNAYLSKPISTKDLENLLNELVFKSQ